MSLTHRTSQSFNKYHLGAILGCLAFGVPLIGYMINGSTMRYSGDDYCYASVLTKLGFWKAQWVSYADPQPYNGNRYSLTFFSDLSGLLGPRMNGALPALVIVIWLAGMTLAMRKITSLVGMRLHGWEIVFLAEILIFFTLYTAPSLPQILYWRSGMLPYLAPLVANTYLIYFIIKHAQNNQKDIVGLVLIGFIAILSGGFSEAATVLQLGYLTFWLVIILLIRENKTGQKRQSLQAILVAWAFSILSLLLLALSPANSTYLDKLSRPNMLELVTLSINSGLSFVLGSITSRPIPTAVLFSIAVAMFWLIFTRHGEHLRLTLLQQVKAIILVTLLSFILIIGITAPSAYAQSAYPELRTLITAQYVIVLAITVLGGLSALLLINLAMLSQNRQPAFRFAVLGLLVVLSIYPIYGARHIYSEIPRYQHWVSFWDKRDATIRLASLDAVPDVQVIQIDHIIPFVSELSADPGFWYNQCAAGYYEVKSIRADLPGWDTQ